MARNGSKKGDAELVIALASGTTVKDAAQRAGVGQRTVYRRLNDAKFRQRVAVVRDELFQRAVGALADAAAEAVETLRELLDSDSPSTQLGAARAILEHGPKLREQSDLVDRITQLENKRDAKK